MSKWKLCEIQKYFFYSHGKFFRPKQYSVIKMVTFNLPTNLHLFVSLSTCFIHSIINILVKKPFSFFLGGGEFLTKCTWGGNRSHGPTFLICRLIQVGQFCLIFEVILVYPLEIVCDLTLMITIKKVSAFCEPYVLCLTSRPVK